jgi:hypothetical protein
MENDQNFQISKFKLTVPYLVCGLSILCFILEIRKKRQFLERIITADET